MHDYILPFLLVIAHFSSAQTYTVEVDKGFGAGIYEPGDTVYLFSRELDEYEVFSHWTFSPSAPAFITDEREWKLAFIMPSQDLNVVAHFDQIPKDFIQAEMMLTSSLIQPVYTAIPENHRGTVFLFHGTGGQATGWVGQQNGDRWQLTKDLYHRGFAVVIPESQESTERMDLNGDDKIRWFSFPIDTINNPDYQNMKIIIDSLSRRGDLRRDKLYSIGMSAGGSFSGTFSVAFNTRASVIYEASSQPVVADCTQSSLLFCMMPNDEIIEQSGIDAAFAQHTSLVDRGLCSVYFLNTPSPLYPEYFQRAGLSASASTEVFEEINNNNFTNNQHFLTRSPRELETTVRENPNQWPVLTGLSGQAQNAVAGLLTIAFGGHKFFASHNQRTIEFLENPCQLLVTTQTAPTFKSAPLRIFPNPSRGQVQVLDIQPPFHYQVYDALGHLVHPVRLATATNFQLDLAPGVYHLVVRQSDLNYTTKLVVID